MRRTGFAFFILAAWTVLLAGAGAQAFAAGGINPVTVSGAHPAALDTPTSFAIPAQTQTPTTPPVIATIIPTPVPLPASSGDASVWFLVMFVVLVLLAGALVLLRRTH